MSYWTIRKSVKQTLARHINEMQTQSSQENYDDITTHSPEYEEPSNIGESSNNLNVFKVENICQNFTSHQSDSDNFGDEDSYYLLSDSDSDSSVSNNYQEQQSGKYLSTQLSEWVVDFGITMDAVSALLNILHFVTDLPKDPRILLATKTSYTIQEKCGGQYYHFGIKKSVMKIISCIDTLNLHANFIQVQINVDGLPLLKSSNHQFWPILGRIVNVPTVIEPFVIGIFSGTSKPTNLSEYLDDLVKEYKDLQDEEI